MDEVMKSKSSCELISMLNILFQYSIDDDTQQILDSESLKSDLKIISMILSLLT